MQADDCSMNLGAINVRSAAMLSLRSSYIVGYGFGHGLWMFFSSRDSFSHLSDPYCLLFFLSHPLCIKTAFVEGGPW